MEKIWTEMYEAAKAVLSERRISEYLLAGKYQLQFFQNRERYTRVFVSIQTRHLVFVQKEMLFLI